MRMTYLVSDLGLYAECIALVVGLWMLRKKPFLAEAFKRVLTDPKGMTACLLLLFYFSIALLDSVHFYAKPNSNAPKQCYSLLDWSLRPLGDTQEKTYSKPFATHSYTSEIIRTPQGIEQIYAPLMHIDPQPLSTLALRACILAALLALGVGRLYRHSMAKRFPYLPHKTVQFTLSVLIGLTIGSMLLVRHYHILGTDKVGQDIFYVTLKSIRTGMLIGTLATLIMLPLSVTLGMLAGFLGKRIDDAIQYLYTTISSIPGVLLIAASLLSVQAFLANHPLRYHDALQLQDIRLLTICFLLGCTSWTGLCRLIRAETLKLRELEFVQTAITLGSSTTTILRRHILPNITPLILILITFDFSEFVLAEAALSYVGIGVDPSMHSFGNSINVARLELTREPVIWWPLCSTFVFLFALVAAANIFSEMLCHAFDPRQHTA